MGKTIALFTTKLTIGKNCQQEPLHPSNSTGVELDSPKADCRERHQRVLTDHENTNAIKHPCTVSLPCVTISSWATCGRELMRPSKIHDPINALAAEINLGAWHGKS
jgi:hypothetical protein